MKRILTTFFCLLGLQATAQINQDSKYDDFVRLMDSLAITQDDIDYIMMFSTHKTLYFNKVAYSRTGKWQEEIWISTTDGWYIYPEAFFRKYAQSLTSKEYEKRTAN